MSASMKSNNYKNVVKGLRKLSLGIPNEERVRANKKYSFNFLEDIETNFESSNELTIQGSREKNSINFNDLPEDTIFLILGFLSYNTRLAILKHKYSKCNVKYKIEKITKSIKGLNQIWKCAEISICLLESLVEDESDILQNLSIHSVTIFKEETNPEIYSDYYRENFTKIIWAALHHYSKIYKFSYYTNKKVIEHIEKTILNIFAHLSEMKQY